MNRTASILLTVVVVLLVLGFLTRTRISCYESFWDKDRKVIEVEQR